LFAVTLQALACVHEHGFSYGGLSARQLLWAREDGHPRWTLKLAVPPTPNLEATVDGRQRDVAGFAAVFERLFSGAGDVPERVASLLDDVLRPASKFGTAVDMWMACKLLH
jgi:hypothetical protein